MERILVINPGSTSSKIAVYDGEQQAFLENINHPVEEIGVYPTTYDQLQYRIDLKQSSQEQALINELRMRNGNLTIRSTIQAPVTIQL